MLWSDNQGNDDYPMLNYDAVALSKGPLISKCHFGIFNSSKKWTNILNLTTIVAQVELFSFFFFKNWRHKKDIWKLTDL